MFSTPSTLRIGARPSPMAMAMAATAAERIAEVAPNITTKRVGIRTLGDQWRGDLSTVGGKGAFVSQVERALVAGEIDIAIHAMKDVPGDQPMREDAVFGAYLPRRDVHDVLVARRGSPYGTLAQLPPGTRIGTSAVRRHAQLRKHRPDLAVDRIRGNADTRISVMDEGGQFEAIVLNRSGLDHIGLGHRATQVLPTDLMCPPVGAGVVGVQCRSADTEIAALLEQVDDPTTRLHVSAERSMLYVLRGHCNSPIAGHCHTSDEGQLSLVGMVFNGEGDIVLRTHETGPAAHPCELGTTVATSLLHQGARAVIDGTAH